MNFLHYCLRYKEKRTPVTEPQVSVILPCYEGEHWLRRAIESVAVQKGVSWELVVVDDGSPLSPEAIVQSFRDERIRYYQISHAGKGAALNRGIAESRAGLLCFLDQDDIMLPDRLCRQVAVFDTEPVSEVAYSDYESVSVDNRLIGRFVSRQAGNNECLRRMATETSLLAMQTIMIRKTLFERIGGFSEDPALTGLDDAEFLARLFVSDAKLHYEPGAVQQWVRHERNYSRSETFQQARLVFLEHIHELAGRHPEIREVLRRFSHNVYYMRGLFYLENGRPREALPEFVRAVKSYPYVPNTYYLLLKSGLLRFIPAVAEVADRAGSVSRISRK